MKSWKSLLVKANQCLRKNEKYKTFSNIKMKMRWLLYLVLLVILAFSVVALPARPELFLCDGVDCSYSEAEVYQGDVIRVQSVGDFRSSFSYASFEGEEFFVVQENDVTGRNWYWGASDESGTVLNSGFKIKENPKTVGVIDFDATTVETTLLAQPFGVNTFDSVVDERRVPGERFGPGNKRDENILDFFDEEEEDETQIEIDKGGVLIENSGPTKGGLPTGFVVYEGSNLDTLVLFVEFPDVEHSVPINSFDTFMGKFSDYYYLESSGNFFVDYELERTWYEASEEMGYYGGDYESNIQELVEEVLVLADTSINYADFDSNGDSVLDSLVIVHAGGPDEDGGGNTDEIWSHYFVVDMVLDGILVEDYLMISEDSPVGILSHEFGHFLGLPDLYDTDVSDGVSHGVGYYGLMAYGPYLDEPSGFTPWSKNELGWLDEGNTKIVGVNEYFGLNENYYLQILLDSEEYFFLENRDIELPSDSVSGVLIWHVDETVGSEMGTWDFCVGSRMHCNTVNGDEDHKLIDLEEAGGSQDLDGNGYGGDEDVWQKDCGLVDCSDYRFFYGSTPNSDNYAGEETPVDIAVTSVGDDKMDLMVLVNKEKNVYINDDVIVDQEVVDAIIPSVIYIEGDSADVIFAGDVEVEESVEKSGFFSGLSKLLGISSEEDVVDDIVVEVDDGVVEDDIEYAVEDDDVDVVIEEESGSLWWLWIIIGVIVLFIAYFVFRKFY
jgi:M6 family metalloprotease-like protein